MKKIPMVLVFFLAGAAIYFSQAPTTLFPNYEVQYTCTPTTGNGAAVMFKFSPSPAPRFDVYVGATPDTGDSQNPVIVSITNTAGVDVTAGAVKLLAGNNGLPITITATDNTGVVGGRLDVDGKLGTPFGNNLDVLPSTFFVRWNAKTVAAGVHNFRLTVWDATQNKAERTWSMTK